MANFEYRDQEFQRRENILGSQAKAVAFAKKVPVSTRIAAKVRGRNKGNVNQRLKVIEERVARQNKRLRRLEDHIPNLLNTIASQHGSQRVLTNRIDGVWQIFEERFDDPDSGAVRSIAAIWDRIETVRKEILFELKYSVNDDSGSRSPSSEHSVDPVINNEALVSAQRESGLRLNIGCGHIPIEGYLNVDMRDMPGVDVVASADHLPFDSGTVEEIYSAHVLEHFPVELLRRKLLPYWVNLLATGGTFRAVVPDADAMVSRYSSGELPYENFREVFFGGQEYEGDFHFNMFTHATLTKLLEQAGLKNVTLEAVDRQNGISYEFQIRATKD